MFRGLFVAIRSSNVEDSDAIRVGEFISCLKLRDLNKHFICLHSGCVVVFAEKSQLKSPKTRTSLFSTDNDSIVSEKTLMKLGLVCFDELGGL